jgi:hypothetical protein
MTDEQRKQAYQTEARPPPPPSAAPTQALSFATARKYWHPPFKHDSGMIVDKDFHRILDVRGWGHLTGHGAHRLPEVVAADIQDAIGESVAVLLTDHWQSPDVSATHAALLARCAALEGALKECHGHLLLRIRNAH